MTPRAGSRSTRPTGSATPAARACRDWIALRSGRLGRGAGRRRASGRRRRGPRPVRPRPRRDGAALHPVRRRHERRRRRHRPTRSRPAGRSPVDLDGLAGPPRPRRASGLATFGAGTIGPALEAALGAARADARALSRSRGSARRSAAGSSTRSAGQQSLGFGRIEALFAGGRLEAPAGRSSCRRYPASAAGPDLRQIVLGSEGRLGILTEVTVRIVADAAARALSRLVPARTGTGRSRLAHDLAQARPAAVDGPPVDPARDARPRSPWPAAAAASGCSAATSGSAAIGPGAVPRSSWRLSR